jgi:hypothetical protein
MTKTQSPKPPGEQAIRAMLNQYQCPAPFHVVRTRLLGNVATTVMHASPWQELALIWQGGLPVFGDKAELDTFVAVMIEGLWTDLGRHQDNNKPFRLTRLTAEPDAASLGHYAMVRGQEVAGFVTGLFNGETSITLPARALQAMAKLREVLDMLLEIVGLANLNESFADPFQAARLVGQLPRLNRTIETEIHAAIRACVRYRRNRVDGLSCSVTTWAGELRWIWVPALDFGDFRNFRIVNCAHLIANRIGIDRSTKGQGKGTVPRPSDAAPSKAMACQCCIC